MIHQLRLAALLLITLPEGNRSRRRGAVKEDLGQVGEEDLSGYFAMLARYYNDFKE